MPNAHAASQSLGLWGMLRGESSQGRAATAGLAVGSWREIGPRSHRLWTPAPLCTVRSMHFLGLQNKLPLIQTTHMDWIF